jgi:hypothetical protein
MKRQWPLFVVILVLLSLVTHAATTHYVDANGTNSVSPYTNWVTAATNIQDAVIVATSGDTVLVTNGVYQYGGYSFDGSNRVYVPYNNMTVQSVNGPAVTVIQGYQVPGTTYGNNAVRCVFLQTGVTLSGFTLTNGATSEDEAGGGVLCASTNCLVTNCVIINNAAYDGGGASQGTLINCSLIGNTASPVDVGNGGGASLSTLINCLLARNFAGYVGGAASGCTLINCTVANNSAAASSGSLSGGYVYNSIVYYNFSYYTNADTGGGNAFTNCCLSFPVSGGANNFTNPPLFANLTAGDFHLSAASPCINAGNNAFITNATDLDGNPRIVGGIVDLGAYEFQSPVRYVNISNTAPISPFTNWITAATNIQDAIDAANAGDFIVVSNGTYNAGGRVVYGALTNRIVINKPVTVQSVNGSASTVIAGFRNANVASLDIRCAYLTNGATLIGFTLTNGATSNTGDIYQAQSGGGAWCNDSGAVLSNCVFAGNYAAQYGGGAFQGTLFNCLFTNNSASYGGGAASNALFGSTLIRNSSMYQNYNYGGGAYACTLSNSLIVGNQSVAGGGFGAGAAFSTLFNCTISNNVAGSGGGGVFMGIANSSLISSNRASNGGGACSNVLNNCLLQQNLAGQEGGGAYSCALVNCTVVSNAATGDGGGVFVGGATNSIIYDNSALLGSNFYEGSALSYCCVMPSPSLYKISGPGNITNDPVFANPAGGDFHLQSNSPCINSGNNAYVTSTTDLDGNPRIVGGTVDIGAYEYQTPTSVISYAWLQQYGLPTDGSVDYADLDGSGFTVYQDWIAGLNPTNALSVLAMLPPVPTNNPAGLVVSWESVSNITYFLRSSTNLGMQPAFSTIQSNIVGQTGTTSYTDTSATNAGPYFYRVGVQQ